MHEEIDSVKLQQTLSCLLSKIHIPPKFYMCLNFDVK